MATITTIQGTDTLRDSRSVINQNFENINAQLESVLSLGGIPGPQGPAGPMGTGIVWRGTWNNGTFYAQHDAVSWQGQSYVAILANIATTPGTDPAKWQIFAAKGDSSANAIGAQSSRPGSMEIGQLYLATDAPFINLWNGSDYTTYYGPTVVPPPPLGSWNSVNSGQFSASESIAGLNITHTTGGNNRGLFVATPTTPYKIAMRFRQCIASNDGNSWCGAYWLDSTSAPDRFTMAVVRGNGHYINYNGCSFAGSSSYGGIYEPVNITMGMIGPELNLIFEDDGINRSIYSSPDGINYILGSGWPRSRTDNSAYSWIGFGISGTTKSTITLTSWRVF